ncbi:MAG: hypothetical protein J3Q66DRAFT_352554 [Benniella sp.]|nr:MAG: hypothetical protein J3Q66DRAFT_352554 [Benniella sp.]
MTAAMFPAASASLTGSCSLSSANAASISPGERAPLSASSSTTPMSAPDSSFFWLGPLTALSGCGYISLMHSHTFFRGPPAEARKTAARLSFKRSSDVEDCKGSPLTDPSSSVQSLSSSEGIETTFSVKADRPCRFSGSFPFFARTTVTFWDPSLCPILVRTTWRPSCTSTLSGGIHCDAERWIKEEQGIKIRFRFRHQKHQHDDSFTRADITVGIR